MSNKWRKALKIELIIILLGLVLVYALYTSYELGYIRINYPSQTKYPIRGIDVSNHQKEINWNLVDKQRVKFAYIKATEGGDFKDKRFKTNWTNARANDIPVGAYHFFTFCKSGIEQAQNFIETVPNETNMLPPAIDLEYSGNCKLTKSKDILLKDIDDFIQTIEKTYNRRMIIYVTERFYNDYLVDLYPDNRLWVRDVFKEAHVIDDRDWLFWQYADNARISGITTLVDLNIFKGSKLDFETFLSERIYSSEKDSSLNR